MPKKTNSKALAARDRKEADKNAKKSSADKATEDAKWTDDGQDKKSKQRAKEADKARLAAEKKKKKQELEEADKKELTKGKPTKEVAPKVTQAAIAARRVQAQKEAAAAKLAQEKKDKRIVSQPELRPNDNRPTETEDEFDQSWVSSVDAALKTMQLDAKGGEKHPEKRLKAAYKVYAERNMATIKQDYPGLKLSQWREKLWNQWQKAPENPLNQQ